MPEYRCDCGHLESVHPGGGRCTWCKGTCEKFQIGAGRLSKSTSNSNAIAWIVGVGAVVMIVLLLAQSSR